jgi:hypothetical protein
MLIYFNSCDKKVDHIEAIHYYIQLQKDVNFVSQKVNYFAYQLVRPIQESNGQINSVDKVRLDSMSISFQIAMKALKKSSEDLSKIKEIDSDIDLIDNTLAFNTDVQNYLNSIWTLISKMMYIGIDKSTDQQKKSLGELIEYREILKEKQLSLQDKFKEFKSKYNITDKELTDNGL